MERGWRAVAPKLLTALVADRIAAVPGVVRVAVDGSECAGPEEFAASLVEPLRERGRPAVHLRAAQFWRDASVRLEYGHRDVDSYPDWLDVDALQREVLTALDKRSEYLPSLRDPVTNRSTREPARVAAPDSVVLVSGAFLLGRGLSFELTVHRAMSPAAMARHTPDDDLWTLPALERYERQVASSDVADIVVRVDDPRHPAVRL
ncbi:MAG: uridine kinase [Jatrophihabitans sp.]